jgi:hypothetical protein
VAQEQITGREAAVTIGINGLPVSYEHGAWVCLGVIFIVVFVIVVIVVFVLFILNAFVTIFFLVVVAFVDGDILAITESRGIESTRLGTRDDGVIGIEGD